MAQAPLPPAPNKYLEGKRCSREWFFGVSERLWGGVLGSRGLLETCLGDLGDLGVVVLFCGSKGLSDGMAIFSLTLLELSSEVLKRGEKSL